MLYSDELLAAEATYRQERAHELFRQVSSEERHARRGAHQHRGSARLRHALHLSHAHAAISG